MITSTGISKYERRSVPWLRAKATEHFNAFIRKRDENKPCISCGERTTLQAGHFYSAGHFSVLAYDEDNVHGQCVRCNYFLSANLSAYRINLEKKIGHERLAALDQKAAMSKRTAFKWDRFALIEIIETHKAKTKEYESLKAR